MKERSREGEERAAWMYARGFERGGAREGRGGEGGRGRGQGRRAAGEQARSLLHRCHRRPSDAVDVVEARVDRLEFHAAECTAARQISNQISAD